MKVKLENRNSCKKRENHYEYKIGDRVNLLDHDDFGIIYKEKDNFYNVVVYYNGEFIEVNVKRYYFRGSSKGVISRGIRFKYTICRL